MSRANWAFVMLYLLGIVVLAWSWHMSSAQWAEFVGENAQSLFIGVCVGMLWRQRRELDAVQKILRDDTEALRRMTATLDRLSREDSTERPYEH